MSNSKSVADSLLNMPTPIDWQRRFGGIAKIYGESGLHKLMQAHVCVIGVGGVGSWAVEALARSAIGQLTLIDLDNVSESNINRQLPALDSTLGAAKITVLKRRIHDIHPDCQVNLIEDFISPDNLDALLGEQTYDFIIDCIDNSLAKAALIAYCKRKKIRIITLGGAGGQRDPGKIRMTDLTRSQQDPLLARVRKRLRQQYGFSTNPKRRFSIPCVWSEEPMFIPNTSDANGPTMGNLSCAGGLGSVMTVTASFALLAVSHVLEKIALEPHSSASIAGE